MTNCIKVLSPHEAQKIAAGEVVERPASVVKELLENSLDAGATHITLKIEDGGKKLIRIIDNGSGMSLDDARLSIINHATSKISSVAELTSIATFGFRGEALASIAAVSHMTLRTKQLNAEHGYELTIEASTIMNEQPVAHNVGTDIAIHNLFYNVPARKKFLKTRDTEWRAIATLVHAYALDYPRHSFTIYHDNSLILNCTSVASLAERALQVFEQPVHQHLVTVTPENNHLHYAVEGVISGHQYGRYDRSQLYFFVNKRWVKNHKLGQAVVKAYQGVLPNGRYPLAVISITVPASEVDINIHPRKEEVQFMHPRIVEDMIYNVVNASLQAHAHAPLQATAPKMSISFPQLSTVTINEVKAASLHPSTELRMSEWSTPNEHHLLQTSSKKNNQDASAKHNSNINLNPISAHPELSRRVQQIHDNAPTVQEQQTKLVHAAEAHTQEQEQFTILGNYSTTYILVETKQGLMLVDQHAAHERILYEEFAQRVTQAESIALLFPETITFSVDDCALLQEHLPLIQHYGIEIEPWSTSSVVIYATPVHIKNQSMKDILQEIIGILRETERLEKTAAHKVVHHKVQAMMACKAAVKAGDILSMQEMETLLQQLLKTPNKLTCPHGRPTSWLLSQSDIERKFKRITT